MDAAVEIDDVSKTFKLYHERGTSLKERLVKAGRSRYDELERPALTRRSFSEVPRSW